MRDFFVMNERKMKEKIDRHLVIFHAGASFAVFEEGEKGEGKGKG